MKQDVSIDLLLEPKTVLWSCAWADIYIAATQVECEVGVLGKHVGEQLLQARHVCSVQSRC